jgi:hypothetical protein
MFRGAFIISAQDAPANPDAWDVAARYCLIRRNLPDSEYLRNFTNSENGRSVFVGQSSAPGQFLLQDAAQVNGRGPQVCSVVPKLGLVLSNLCKCGLDPPEQVFSGNCGGNAPGGSGQQPHTDFLFEVAHRMADCGRSDAKSLCSLCETALFRNREKHG